MRKHLLHPYISVQHDRLRSFGGDQRRAQKAITRKCGCGVIACADLLLYLEHRPLPVAAADYNALAEELRRRYLPLLPRFGINGLLLTLGLNRCLRSRSIHLRATWGVRPGRLQRCIGGMLARDLPVILAIGPNFPLFWRRKKLTLYKTASDGSRRPAGSTCAHYVTVTAMDDEWLHISSWGEAYSIRWAEYRDYVKRCSSWLVSNIVCLRPTRQRLFGKR